MSVRFSFPQASAAQANQMVSSLQTALHSVHRDVTLSRQKETEASQDAGTILTVVAGSAAVTAVARGISAWLAKQGNPVMDIVMADGTRVHIDRVDANTPAALQAALGKQ